MGEAPGPVTTWCHFTAWRPVVAMVPASCVIAGLVPRYVLWPVANGQWPMASASVCVIFATRSFAVAEISAHTLITHLADRL